MNSDPQFLDERLLERDSEPVEAIVTQPQDTLDTSAEKGTGTMGASVAGAVIGAVIGGKVAGTKGAVVGAVAGAVAGGLTAKAVPDDAGEKLNEAVENTAAAIQDKVEQAKPSIEATAENAKQAAIGAANRIQDTAERAKPSLENTVDKAKNAALNTANQIQDRAERTKPSYRQKKDQEYESVELSEPFVVEPAMIIADEIPIVLTSDDLVVTEVEVIELCEVPEEKLEREELN